MDNRIVFISDIHANIEAFKSVILDIKNRNIDFESVYCLGDSVGYGTRPSEVIQLLKENNIKSILGNYDEAVGFYLPTCGCTINNENDKMNTKNSLTYSVENTTKEDKEYFRSLEEEISIEFKGKKIRLTHASPVSITDYVYFEDEEKQIEIASELEEDILVFGHTHIPFYKYVGNKLFVNDGSVGRPKDGDNRACYCILTIEKEINVEFVRVQYDIEKMAKEIEESELLDSFADVLRKGKV